MKSQKEKGEGCQYDDLMTYLTSPFIIPVPLLTTIYHIGKHQILLTLTSLVDILIYHLLFLFIREGGIMFKSIDLWKDAPVYVNQ